MKRLATCVAVGLLGAVMTACGGDPLVVRVYDGTIVEGRYVSPDAYAAFLRGVLAEESGDLAGALTAYRSAASEDDRDPEIFSRIGETSCRLDPKGPDGDRAFARALTLDPTYAGALAAKGRCALARGNVEEATELARRASAADPKSADIEALVVRAAASRPDPAMRERAVALTLAHGELPAAWDALVAWGRGHHDAELVARGFEGLLTAAPLRSAETERAALALLQGGELALARRVASAVTDVPRAYGVVGPRDATVARLAVDEALARGDGDRALGRATRGHVSLAEVAARALLLDKKDIATTIASALAAADPGASGAQMVALALKSPSAPGGHDRAEGPHVTDQPPEICALLFADRLASAAGIEVARAWLAKITRTPMAPHDPLAGPLAVDLAARGVLPVADLPADLRVAAQHAHAAE